jgi:hypothetical protein
MGITHKSNNVEEALNSFFYKFDGGFAKPNVVTAFHKLNSLEKSVVLDFRRDNNIKEIIDGYFYDNTLEWDQFVNGSIIDIKNYINSIPGYPKSTGISHFLQIIGDGNDGDDQIMVSWCGNEGGGTTSQQIACAILIVIIIVAICL